MMEALGKTGAFSNRSQCSLHSETRPSMPSRLSRSCVIWAHKAVSYHFEGGARPSLTRAEAKALQPLFGGTDWAEKRPHAYLGFLNSVLYFTGKDADFRSNMMVLAVGATARTRFWQRWALRKRAKGGRSCWR